jgi:hypothetical protein
LLSLLLLLLPLLWLLLLLLRACSSGCSSSFSLLPAGLMLLLAFNSPALSLTCMNLLRLQP